MTPSPPAPSSTACRLSISRSSTSTRSSSSRSTKPWRAPRIPTNSSCAFRVFAPPATPPAKKWPRKWPTSSASPASSAQSKVRKEKIEKGLLFDISFALFPFRSHCASLRLCVSFSFPLPLVAFDFQRSTVNPVPPLATWHFLFYASPMFGKARKLETEAELYDVAVRALMRRAHSVHEMKQKLERRSDNKLLVQLVMARLKENGQIDDARYAKQFARQRTESRKQGKFRVARDLRARGVPDRHIDAALREAAEETDEGAMVRQRIERKLRSFRGEIDEKKMASIYSSLLRAGFSLDVVRRELKAITKEEVPEVEAGSE